MKEQKKYVWICNRISGFVGAGILLVVISGCGDDSLSGQVEETEKRVVVATQAQQDENISESIHSVDMQEDTGIEGQDEEEIVVQDATIEEQDHLPTIEGVVNQTVVQGQSISYKKGVIARDFFGEEIELQIDATQVNASVPGEYHVIYCATDEQGQEVVVRATITVIEPAEITQEFVDATATEVLSTILIDQMTDYEKLWSIFRWVRKNISYVGNATKESPLRGAYEGLTYRKGDCYIYYAVAEELLRVAGYETLAVERVGGNSRHYWNLVSYEGGWYHFDASPRRNQDPYICFLQTDGQVAYYETTYPEHPNYYTFEGETFPQRATEIVFESAYLLPPEEEAMTSIVP